MRQKLLAEAAAFLVKNRRRRMWTKAVSCMAAVVVFCTTYVLILPALTLEKDTVCGYEEHVHTEECYVKSDKDVSDGSNTQVVSGGDVSAGDEGTYCGKHSHKHVTACFGDSDLTADVETEEDWEASFADVTLTGNCAQDVVAIAQSQVGYAESEKNFIYTEEKELRGYTRYGAWYGDEYGDWNAMFVAFCLNYAQVTEFPVDVDCAEWIKALSQTEYDLYRTASGYTPSAGDVVFFNVDDDDADCVGIVEEVTEDAAQIIVIEGDSEDQVQRITYQADDTSIIGYGMVSVQLSAAEQKQVDEMIEMINNLPSADEIDAKLAEYEDVQDYEGEEAYYTEVCQKIAIVYQYYAQLTDVQKTKVTNAAKLLELEYIWSVMPLIDEISSAAPTKVASVNTSDFIELNLYDYGSNINKNYNRNKKYPGFQWNGGAYKKSTYDRHIVDYIDFGNSMITDFTYGSYTEGNNGKSANSQDIAKADGSNGAINKIDVNDEYGVTNRPIGMSLNSSITATSADVLQRTLRNGYPALADGTSLSYLFKDGTYAVKQNTTSIDGLFQLDETTGKYYYNSRENHAQYSNNKFTLYNQIITPNFIVYPFGNFLPFNSITDKNNVTQVSKITNLGVYIQNVINNLVYASDYSSNGTKKQLVDMLAMYRKDLQEISTTGGTAWTTWNAKNAIVDYFSGASNDSNADNPTENTSLITDDLLNKLYNIDYDVETNFFFGMEMKMNFIQPRDGMTGKDNNKDGIADYPMEFYFTGDDDVWVYVDDVLFLDLSGIHRHVGGKIDFKEGKVYYYALDTKNSGDVASTPYKTYTFGEILQAARADTSGLNAKGAFEDYSVHTFKFYYMERGSGSSVCRMEFNFPLLKQHTIAVEKELADDDTTDAVEALGNPDFTFQVLAAEPEKDENGSTKLDENRNPVYESYFKKYDETGSNWAYSLYDTDGAVIQEITIVSRNEDGTVKEMQVCNADGKVVRKEVDGVVTDSQNGEVLTVDEYGRFTLKAGQKAEFVGIPESWGQYFVRELLPTELAEQYGEVSISGSTVSKTDNLVIDGATFVGQDSPVYDSYVSSSFKFTNEIDNEKLGSLSIEKIVDATYSGDKTKEFEFDVKIGGELLPVGTSYTVGSITQTITTAGRIKLKNNETAVISNIIAGTQFEVTEVSHDGYTVSYMVGNELQNTTSATGTIGTDTRVAVKITNSEIGTSVEIPIWKSVANNDGVERNYTFVLQKAKDKTGTLPGGDTNSNINMTIENLGTVNGGDKFVINYLPQQVTGSSGQQTFYYKISEVVGNTVKVQYDDTYYVVEVTVTKNGTEMSAEITGVWKNGTDNLSTDVFKSITSGDDINKTPIVFNNVIVRTITLSKTVVGSAVSEEEEFTFTVKLDAGDDNTPIPEVIFGTLTEADKTKSPVSYPVSDSQFEAKLKDGESVVLEDIPYGLEYTITEVKTDGFKVTCNIGAGEQHGSSVSGTVGETDIAVAFTNTRNKQYVLPETGGIGTHMYALAGIALISGAAYLLYRRGKSA